MHDFGSDLGPESCGKRSYANQQHNGRFELTLRNAGLRWEGYCDAFALLTFAEGSGVAAGVGELPNLVSALGSMTRGNDRARMKRVD